MRFLISVALAALLVGPAAGQRLLLANEQLAIGQKCDGGGPKASRDYAVNINEAVTAYQAKDHAAAMNALERARPHAANSQQISAVMQIEIGVMLQAGAGQAAVAKLEAALLDPCVPDAVRRSYRTTLDGLQANPAAAPPH